MHFVLLCMPPRAIIWDSVGDDIRHKDLYKGNPKIQNLEEKAFAPSLPCKFFISMMNLKKQSANSLTD